MVIGITELRRLLSRAQTSAGRAVTQLKRLQNSPLRKPSTVTVDKMGRQCAKALGDLADIVEIFQRILG